MSKIQLKIEPAKKSSLLKMRRSYQHVAIGYFEYPILSVPVNASFMDSLSLSVATIRTLSFKNIRIRRDSLISCICDLKNLSELTLDEVECTFDGIVYEEEIFNAPKLKSLVLHDLESGHSLITNALLLMNIQSQHIELSRFQRCMEEVYDIILSQKTLQSLVITNLCGKHIENFTKKLKEPNVYFDDLKRFVIVGKLDENYPEIRYERMKRNIACFIKVHACNLRELFLENLTLSPTILEVIVNDMQLVTLSFKKLSDLNILKEKMSELKVNRHLKKLLIGYADGLDQLVLIFPSIETFKSKFSYPQIMDDIGSFRRLQNFCLDLATSFDDMNLTIPSLKLIAFKFVDFPEICSFLESNCSTIEALVIKSFNWNSSHISADAILTFFSKFKRVLITADEDNDSCNLDSFISLQNYNTKKYCDKVFIEACPNTFYVSKSKHGKIKISNVLRMLRRISHKTFSKLERKF